MQNTHKHKHSYTNTHTHTQSQYTQSYTHTQKHTNTHKHSHTNTHTHTLFFLRHLNNGRTLALCQINLGTIVYKCEYFPYGEIIFGREHWVTETLNITH